MSLKQWGIKMNKTLSTNWFKRQRKNWWQPHKNSKYKLKVMSRVKNFLPLKLDIFLQKTCSLYLLLLPLPLWPLVRLGLHFSFICLSPVIHLKLSFYRKYFFTFFHFNNESSLFSWPFFVCIPWSYFNSSLLWTLWNYLFIRGRLWKHILPFQLKCLRLSWNIWEIRQVEKSEESQWLSLIWSKRVSWKWTKCCLCISVQSQENKPTVLMSVLLA